MFNPKMDIIASDKHNKSAVNHSRIRALWRVRYLLKWLPRRRSLSRYPVLGKFSCHLRNQNYLWSFKESRVAPAILIGSVVAFLPIFGVQLLTVMAIALILKVNLPILAGLQFISNPLTLIPIYLANYKVGSWLLESFGFNPISQGGSGNLLFGLHSTLVGGIVLGSLVGLFLYGLYFVRIKWLLRTSKVAL
ncbi:MAG: DUF2062 domain-containing protein [Verrucomicrobia bacterium]|nr:DUF2062 domain-containing protein [Verrucomicrobiota bacterium]